MSEVRKLRLVLTPTADWERVRAFYRDLLGLVEAGGWELPGDRGAFLSGGAGELELMEADARALGVLPPSTAGWALALEVTDAAAAHARVLAVGVPVLRDLTRQPWGTLDFVVEDPAGRPVLLYEEPPPFP